MTEKGEKDNSKGLVDYESDDDDLFIWKSPAVENTSEVKTDDLHDVKIKMNTKTEESKLYILIYIHLHVPVYMYKQINCYLFPSLYHHMKDVRLNCKISDV